MHPESLVAPGVGYPSITEDVASVPLRFPSPRAWWIGFGLSTLTLASTTGGAPADTRTCTFRFESTDFARPTPACLLTTTGAYDALDVVVGWDGATTGSPTLDALSLTRG